MKNRFPFITSAFIGITMFLQIYPTEEATVINTYNEYEMSESSPIVNLEIRQESDFFDWGSQVRYSINVNDETDGDSRYNEINSNEVFLEIDFVPEPVNSHDIQSVYERINGDKNLKGLTLLGRSSCFGCHADKSNMIGPSFSEVAGSYTNNTANINKLVNSIQHGSAGVWGQAEMPANPDISEEEASDIAGYILKQGAQEYSRISPGLEGVIRIMDKPPDIDEGTYILTASYTSSAQKRGEDTVVLKIK
ncbi:MAG: c-type cytochrome [Balneolaceae bacterium]